MSLSWGRLGEAGCFAVLCCLTNQGKPLVCSCVDLIFFQNVVVMLGARSNLLGIDLSVKEALVSTFSTRREAVCVPP